MAATRLDALLAEAFSAAELKQLADHYDPKLLAEVSFEGPTKEIASEFIQVLRRQKRLDQEFIDLVIEHRPNSSGDIRAAAASYLPQHRPHIETPSTVLEAYRTRMLERHGRISMIGVQVDDFEFSMDDVYVPLRFVEAAAEMKLQGKRRTLGEPGRSISVDHIFRTVQPYKIPTIMGEAGSGKTTAMLKLLHTVFTQPPEALHLPPAIVPCFGRLASLKDTTDTQMTQGRGRHWIEGPLGRLVQAPLTNDEWSLLSAVDRPLLILFDGLDEIADPHRRQQALQLIDRAVQADPNLWAVVSCRHSARGYAIDFPPRCKRLTVQPLDDGQRQSLTMKWFTTANHASRCPNPQEKAHTQTQALLDALVSTPLFATLQCVLHLVEPTLPQNSVQFLLAALEVLLERKQRFGIERRPRRSHRRGFDACLGRCRASHSRGTSPRWPEPPRVGSVAMGSDRSRDSRP